MLSLPAVVVLPSYCYNQFLPKFLMMLDWHRSHTLTEHFSLTGDRTSAAFRSTSSKQYALNRVTTGPEPSFYIVMFNFLFFYKRSQPMRV